VTSSPLDQPVAFTFKVLLDPGFDKGFDTPIVPVQEHFSLPARQPDHEPA
jgi:hypothetical protein